MKGKISKGMTAPIDHIFVYLPHNASLSTNICATRKPTFNSLSHLFEFFSLLLYIYKIFMTN
jgi:hypothetical protein